MDSVIVVTESRLIELIENAVGKYFKQVEAPRQEPDNISGQKSAINYLRENGYEICKSTFSTRTARGMIPCRRFNKRVLYSKNELIAWAERNCERVVQSNASLMLAKNANRKLRYKSN